MRITIIDQQGKKVYNHTTSFPATEEGRKDEADNIERIITYLENGPT
jgi:hypothetical protein